MTNVDSFQNKPLDLDQGRMDSWDNIFEHGDWCSVCSLSATMSDRRGACYVGLVEDCLGYVTTATQPRLPLRMKENEDETRL